MLGSIAVEGKVNEPFDKTLSEWLSQASPEKRKRLAGLSALLGLTVQPPPTTRYQLMHRAASALIEARHFHAQTAVLLVHSFSQTGMWHSDYAAFATLFGATGAIGMLEDVGVRDEIRLFLGWVTGDAHFLGL